MNSNEYERLIKEGYIESGTLVIKVDDITKMQLNLEQVKLEAAKQRARQDKGVVIVDKHGRMKKVSSLLMGYNKHNIQLADGTFANSDDLLAAMETAINKLDTGTIIIDKKGKILNPEDLLHVAKEAAGKVIVKEPSPKITNQDNRYWAVEGANSDREYKKGVVFLGNNGIDLKQGDYISVDELMKALNEYMVMKPSQNVEHPEPVVARCSHKYKNKLSKWLALASALVVLMSGFSIKDNNKTIEIPKDYEEQIVQFIEQEQLDYMINGMEVEYTYETLEQAKKRIVSNYKIGDELPLQAGDVLYENSELQGNTIQIGEGIRKPGNYEISGVSIVYNGNMYSWHVDTSVSEPGFEIGKFINETCEKNNLDLDKVEVRLHMGNSTNFTRTGWINISKLIKDNSAEQQVISENSVIASTYKGEVKDFNGSTITINSINGPVTIKVVDQSGNLLKPGTIVIGSDGQEYMVGDLSLSTTEVLDTQTIIREGTEKKQVSDGKKLTWSIQDCSLAVGIAPMLAAIAAALATKKKNEEAQKNPSLFKFDNEEEYLKFKKEFEEAKENYEKKSGYKKLLKELFFRKEVDILQRLTPDQTQQLYSIITNWHDENYSYKQGDRIMFRDGKIIVINNEGKEQDITSIVMPAIAALGKDNKVEAEGLLQREEEKENGIRRR